MTGRLSRKEADVEERADVSSFVLGVQLVSVAQRTRGC